MTPRLTLFFGLFLLNLTLVTGCAASNASTQTDIPVKEIVIEETKTPDLPSQTSISSPTQTEETAPPPPEITVEAEITPSLIPLTSTPLVEVTPRSPLFAPAISGDGNGGLYPEQELSIIANTGRIQFLNVYANW